MKNIKNLIMKLIYCGGNLIIAFSAIWILLFNSCTVRHDPYSVLEFAGGEEIYNYSKTGMLIFRQPDSLNPSAFLGSIGDMIISDGDNIFIYNDSSSGNRFSIERDDRAIKVNNRINDLMIPDNDSMISWFEKMSEKDFSALQFIHFSPEMPESYLPYLRKLSEIKPDAGFFFEKDFSEMAALLKIFKPRYIVGAELYTRDYGLLSGLNNLEVLMVSPGDSVINEPLPPMPALKQLFLTNMNKETVLTNNFLVNNKQIERFFIQKNGSFDCSILGPLKNLKELAASESDAIINIEVLNNLKNLEVLSLSGGDLKYDPALLKLPSLRWMAITSKVTQEDFDSFVNAHPGLEVIELIANDTIKSLSALSKLSKLTGLIVTQSVTDVATIRSLVNLKYLSLPVDFLKDSTLKADLKATLKGTRIIPNEGFCLGSGWLLALIPLVMVFWLLRGRRLKSSGTE